MRAHRKPAVVAHRLQLLYRNTGLEHQQAAQLRVAILLDDEVHLVRLQEPPHIVAEREPANPHVIDGDAVGGKQVERLDARCMAATDGHEANFAAGGGLDHRRGHGARRALDFPIDAVDDVHVLVAVFGIHAIPIVTGSPGEVRALRMNARQRAIGDAVAVDVKVTMKRLHLIELSGRQHLATVWTVAIVPGQLRNHPVVHVFVSSLGASEVAILDVATKRDVKRLKTGRGAAGIQMQPDGTRAYVSCTPDDYVAVVDLKTLEVTGRIEAGRQPDGLAWVARR